MVNSSQGNQVDILSSFLLLPSNVLPLVMQGWTLIHEMYFYLVFFILMIFMNKKYLFTALITWGTILTLLNIILDINNPYFKVITNPLTLEFIFGCLLAFIIPKINYKFTNITLFLIATIGFTISLSGFYFLSQENGYTTVSNYDRVLIFGLFSTILLFVFIHLEKNGLILNKSLIKIGDASYSIYLSHILVINVIGKIWSYFSLNTLIDNIIAILVMLIASIIFGLISYKFIEKPLLKKSRTILS